MINSRQELQTQIEKGLGLDFTGIWQVLSFGASFKKKIVNEMNLSQDGVYAVSTFNYLKEGRVLHRLATSRGTGSKRL